MEIKNKTKRKLLIVPLAFILLFPFFSIPAYADSSWVWFTGNPLPILPWVALGTIAIEVFIICLWNQIPIKRITRPLIFIILGNLISFFVPFIIMGITPSFYGYDFTSRIEGLINLGPVYIVNTIFLILTLIFEIPIEYFGIKNMVKSKLRLFLSIIVANAASTAMVAVIERTIYKGSYY